MSKERELRRGEYVTIRQGSSRGKHLIGKLMRISRKTSLAGSTQENPKYGYRFKNGRTWFERHELEPYDLVDQRPELVDQQRVVINMPKGTFLTASHYAVGALDGEEYTLIENDWYEPTTYTHVTGMISPSGFVTLQGQGGINYTMHWRDLRLGPRFVKGQLVYYTGPLDTALKPMQELRIESDKMLYISLDEAAGQAFRQPYGRVPIGDKVECWTVELTSGNHKGGLCRVADEYLSKLLTEDDARELRKSTEKQMGVYQKQRWIRTIKLCLKK